ncbi:Pantothenate synthetase [Corynebacterium hansenii]|nr:Pantothenate synthetase [Corynebacterium hansenii]
MSGYTAGDITVHDTIAGISQVTRAMRKTGRPVVLVPTMGALHEGHLELVRAAQSLPRAVVVVSIFVNPLQFGEGEDFDAYPRTLDDDVAKLKAIGCELVFAPTAREMYPNGFRSTVQPGPLADELEGATRPGHFAGALTVVNKLFNITNCTDAIFGEKDYQQLALMQQMVTDLNMPVQLHGVPVIREADGLAMSSRNRYLSDAERELAVTLSAALTAGAHVGDHGAEAVLSTARAVLDERPEVDVDYLELRGPGLGAAPEEGEARLLVAARVGTTRLIDNVGVLLGDMREREIAQAALSAAGVDDAPLTEEEMAELKRLKARVDEVRAEREAREAREGLRGAGFAAGGMGFRAEGVEGGTVRRPVSEGDVAGTTDSATADPDTASEGGR